jgi:CRISPR-associated protein Csb3
MLEFDLEPGDAFDQLFVIGLASILDAETGTTSHLLWDNGGVVTLECAAVANFSEAANVVHGHARRQAESAWLKTVTHLSVGDRSPLSPRIGKLSTPDAFRELEEARRKLIESIPSEDALTRRFIGALGRPSDWSLSREREVLPDAGASTWEMKTRNRGEEFIQNRLSLLADAVVTRTDQQVQDGLEGVSEIDEVGKAALSSRTPTGLRAPGPADNVRAWCALWGLSALPVRPVVGNAGESTSVTTGAIRYRGSVWFYLPVIDETTTVAGFRTVTQSKYLADQAASTVRIPDISVSAKGVRWLEQHHVRQFFVFQRHRSDNANAPELWAEPGVLHDLAQPLRRSAKRTNRRERVDPLVY